MSHNTTDPIVLSDGLIDILLGLIESVGPFTTIRISRLPRRYTMRQLTEDIDNLMRDISTTRCYDFVYVPLEGRSNTTRSYAVLNLKTPDLASILYERINFGFLCPFEGDKAPIARWSLAQGYKNIVELVRENPGSNIPPMLGINIYIEGKEWREFSNRRPMNEMIVCDKKWPGANPASIIEIPDEWTTSVHD